MYNNNVCNCNPNLVPSCIIIIKQFPHNFRLMWGIYTEEWKKGILQLTKQGRNEKKNLHDILGAFLFFNLDNWNIILERNNLISFLLPSMLTFILFHVTIKFSNILALTSALAITKSETFDLQFWQWLTPHI